MLQPDIAYYRYRVSAERELARNAANPQIAAIHEKLACQYEALIEHPERHGMLREVG